MMRKTEESDSCPSDTASDSHQNQISPKHDNNIPASAFLGWKAGFVWFLQQFFFLMSLFLLVGLMFL